MKRPGFLNSCLLTAVIMAGGAVGRCETARPRYIFVNETADHSHDLALKMSLKTAEQRSGIENALIMLDKLPPSAGIEETAVNLFQRWQIGRDRKGRGILYLYSRAENQFKIEVSYALEGAFPDAFCRRLEEAARTFLLSEIPQDFLSELVITMNNHGSDPDVASGGDLTVPWYPTRFLSGGAGVRSTGYRPTVNDFRRAVQALDLGERDEFRPSPDADESIRRYMESLSRGIGDPRLPLLTEGSQIFRMVVPRNAAQQRRVHSYYQKALPYQLHSTADLGAAVFRPGTSTLPIVVRRSQDGLWHIDEPKAWTYFHRFEDSPDCFQKYVDLPMAPSLSRANLRIVYRGRAPTPHPPSYPFSLVDLVRRLEEATRLRPNDPAPHAELAETYLFEINWISRAIEEFGKAAALAPKRLDYRWRLYDLYLNNSEVEKALEQLQFIADSSPRDVEAREWLRYYTEAYQFKPGEFFP
jgi:tetratricopeptide (TPR) repeat protein